MSPEKFFTLLCVAAIGFTLLFNGSPADKSPPVKTSTPSVTSPHVETKREPPRARIGVVTRYVSNHPYLNADGLCEFTVDNTRNDMPVYVRIWDVRTRQPVRAFTIAQGDKFTAKSLSPGTYEVRYMELYENDAPPFGSKSEPTTLNQYETYADTRYDIVELTLYKVVNGNTTTTQIAADDV